LFVSPDQRAFRARGVSPTGGEGRLVVGPYDGDLPATPTLRLRDRKDDLVAHTGDPVLTARHFVAGQVASLSLLGATPGGQVAAAYSLVGPGPSNSPYGVLSLSPPILQLPVQTANAVGGSVWSVSLPSVSSGISVWLQAYDLVTSRLTPGLALVID
jgi:hypothetical protein